MKIQSILSNVTWLKAQLMWSERQRKRGQVINESEWVSWANAIVILIFENTLRTIHIVPAISTPKSAWRSMTQRAAILWQARVRPGAVRGGDRHIQIYSTLRCLFHISTSMQVANDSARRVSKTRKCCALLLWPFHPDLFAFGVISIDWVYLPYTT